MKTTKKILSNTLYQTIGKIATMGSTVIVTMLVSRHYGPVGYGQLAIILTFPALFFVVADFGMNAIVSAEITKDPKKTNLYFNNLLTLRTIYSLGLAALGILILQLFPYSKEVKLAASFVLPTVVTFSIYTTANAVYQANLAYNRSMIAPILRSVLLVLLVSVMVSFGVSVTQIVWAYIASELVLASVSLALVQKYTGKIRPVFDKATYRFIFLAAVPLGIATITNPIIGKADTLLLSVMKTEADVGFYNLAYKVFEVALVVPVFFVNAAYPYMIRHREESLSKLFQTSKKLLVALLLMGFGSLAFVWLAAPLLVKILGGSGFTPSVLPMRLLALSLPVFYATNIFFWFLITVEKRKIIPVIYWLAVVINVGANLFVIPRWSFNGAAIVNGLTELFVLVAFVVEVFRVQNHAKEVPLGRDL